MTCWRLWAHQARACAPSRAVRSRAVRVTEGGGPRGGRRASSSCSVERFVPVRDSHGIAQRREIVREALGDVDGAVPASRAPDGDREVRPVLAPVVRKTESEEILEAGVEGLGLLASLDESRDLRVAPRPGPEARVEMRIREEAHVETEVESGGGCVLEAEGGEGAGGKTGRY